MSSEPNVGEAWEWASVFGGMAGLCVVTNRIADSSTFHVDFAHRHGVVHRSSLKRRVELREGQVWQTPSTKRRMTIKDWHVEDTDAAKFVRDGWTLVSEPEETPTPAEMRERVDAVVGELKYAASALPSDVTAVTMRPWNGPQSFAQRHKPLAEAFAAIAKAMQTPRGIILLNRQWCDEQVANPPRWARDGRGVARGERFEAFKVGLCNEVAKWSERCLIESYRDKNGKLQGNKCVRQPVRTPMSTEHEFTLGNVRQYVDQQCGEAPAWR